MRPGDNRCGLNGLQTRSIPVAGPTEFNPWLAVPDRSLPLGFKRQNARMADRGYERLTGGFATPTVVKVDGTVRRSTGATSRTVHALLQHLERNGFRGAPRSYGFDDAGRHVLEYVEGQAATGRPPPFVWQDSVLKDVTRLVRAFHDSVADFEAPSWAAWGAAVPPATMPAELVCHNDLGPWNTVFRDRRPVAFIDWDSLVPGSRLWDLAYLAWHWVPLMPVDRRVEVGADFSTDQLLERTRLLFHTYDLPTGGLADVLIQRQHATRAELARRAETTIGDQRRLWRRACEAVQREISFAESLQDELRRLSHS